MKWYGWRGVILDIHLSKWKVSKRPLDINLAKMYLGGRGLNSRMLYENIDLHIEPLSPENLLIFSTGPLNGTLAPACCRTTVTAKSPLIGILGDGNVGGFLGPEIKYAGYDSIIFRGKSEKPVYVFIDDDRVEFHDASSVWGKNTEETDKIAKEEIGDNKIQVACIGPAGENLVRYACIMHGSRAAARCGLGAVMGSKKLKAVVVRGSRNIEVAKTEVFIKEVEKAYSKIYNSRTYEVRSKFGTEAPFDPANRFGMLATKNFQTGTFKHDGDLSTYTLYEKYHLRHMACHGCPIHCSHLLLVSKGRFAGTLTEGLHFETMTAFGSKCLNADLASIIYMYQLANRLGLDVIDTGDIIAFTMECYERGILKADDIDGLSLNWGNYESMIKLMEMIAYRKGFGNILAEGMKIASKKVGKGAEKFALHIKGAGISAGELRGMIGMALGHAISSRGSDHLRALVNAELGAWTPEDAERIIGIREAINPHSYDGKPELVKWHEDLGAVTDSLNMCKAVTLGLYALDFKDLARLLSAATGWKVTAKELRLIGERIVTTERYFNIKHGITRADDTLPQRFFNETLPEGVTKGKRINKKKFEEMLDKYYSLRGWNKKGNPPQKLLKRLGINRKYLRKSSFF